MYADKVAEKTGRKGKIEVYGDRLPGDGKQLLEGVQLGTIDGGLVSVPTIPLTLSLPAFDALQLPFLVRDYDAMAGLLSSDVGSRILATLTPLGIQGLGHIEAGQRHFLSRTRPVHTLADFSGLKTRIVPTPLHKAIWDAVGVSPAGMSFGEVFPALETGTIGAVEINLSSAYAESYHQAAGNVTLTGHSFWPGVLMMSGAGFDGLPEDIRAAMAEAGHEVIAEQYAIARDQEAETAAKLKEKGVTIAPLTDIDAMRARVQPVVAAWTAKDPLIAAFAEAAQRRSNPGRQVRGGAGRQVHPRNPRPVPPRPCAGPAEPARQRGGCPMRTLRSTYDLIVSNILVGMLILLLAVISLQVGLRYGLSISLIWAEEICRYLLVWMSFLAVAYERGEVASVPILRDALPPRAGPARAIFANLCGVALLVVLVRQGITYAQRMGGGPIPAMTFVLAGTGMAVPRMVRVYAALPVGLTFLAIRLLVDVLLYARMMAVPGARAADLRAAGGKGHE